MFLSLELLALSYLILPIVIFLLGWPKLTLGLPLLALLLFSLYLVWQKIRPPHSSLKLQKKQSPKKFSRLAINIIFPLLIIFAWTYFSGLGYNTFQNGDYLKHNFILNAITERSFPTKFYTAPDYLYLVYNIAYYLVPALFGKIAGEYLYLALFLWSYLGLCLGFFLLRKIVDTKKNYFLFYIIFFSGLDFLGHLFIFGLPTFQNKHIEWWAVLLQYSANTTMLYWVPQHFIPALLLTGLMSSDLYLRKQYGNLMFYLSLAALWSPFVEIGLVIFVLLALPKRQFYSFQNIFFPLLFNLLMYFYYASTMSSDLNLSFFWDNSIPAWRLRSVYFTFITLEVVVFIPFLYRHLRFEWQQKYPQLLLAIVFLLLLPFLHMGAYNDIVMRSSIPALIFLQIHLWRGITYCFRPYALLPQRLLLVVVLIFAPITGLFEMGRSLSRFPIQVSHWWNYPTYNSFLHMTGEKLSRQYLGDENSFFFTHIARKIN